METNQENFGTSAAASATASANKAEEVRQRYADMMKQAQALLEQANTIRAEERALVLSEIHVKMREFGFTVEELAGTRRKSRKSKSAQVKVGRYVGPNGEIWSGVRVGRKPDWVRKVIAEGGDINDYLVQP